jgi:hypothetical protein
MFFAITAADSNSIDDETLLSLVTQSASFVRAGRAGCTVNHIELAILPASATFIECRVARKMWNKNTELEEEIAEHRIVSSCTAPQCTYTHPFY